MYYYPLITEQMSEKDLKNALDIIKKFYKDYPNTPC